MTQLLQVLRVEFAWKNLLVNSEDIALAEEGIIEVAQLLVAKAEELL